MARPPYIAALLIGALMAGFFSAPGCTSAPVRGQPIACLSVDPTGWPHYYVLLQYHEKDGALRESGMEVPSLTYLQSYCPSPGH